MPDIITSTTQQFLDIHDISNNFVIMKDGTVSVVITVNAMNFGLLAEEEQDAVMYAYAGLLNSLNYPIQIIVNSTTKDVTAYLHLLQEQEETTASETMSRRIRQYREFVSNLIQERNVLDKKFYVSIPASSVELGLMGASTVLPGRTKLDITSVERSVLLEKAQNLLEPKRDHLIAQFARIGLFSRQLSTQEIIQLFYIRYNPEAAEGQQIGESNSYASPLVQASVQGNIMNDQITPPQPGSDQAPAANQPGAQITPPTTSEGTPSPNPTTQAGATTSPTAQPPQGTPTETTPQPTGFGTDTSSPAQPTPGVTPSPQDTTSAQSPAQPVSPTTPATADPTPPTVATGQQGEQPSATPPATPSVAPASNTSPTTSEASPVTSPASSPGTPASSAPAQPLASPPSANSPMTTPPPTTSEGDSPATTPAADAKPATEAPDPEAAAIQASINQAAAAVPPGSTGASEGGPATTPPSTSSSSDDPTGDKGGGSTPPAIPSI